ncbi:LacI family DNA-binding transcriptional regulator, partial [Streptomyces fradiae]|uniref:LacI family DNA-binding transcriptional regulator n=1 Tax=Streptomyces fradiae TaxID=1906 RepID=UPI0015E16948
MPRTGSTAGPTLAVVAREAGVSVPTASKVVNGRDDVAPETRRRVTEVLDRLGYVRRRRGGPPKPHGMIDLVLASPLGGGAEGSAVLHGVERAAHTEGLEVVVSAGRHLGRDRLDRLAVAVGAAASGAAAERAWRRNAGRACGTPWLRLWRWYERLRTPGAGCGEPAGSPP